MADLQIIQDVHLASHVQSFLVGEDCVTSQKKVSAPVFNYKFLNNVVFSTQHKDALCNIKNYG